MPSLPPPPPPRPHPRTNKGLILVNRASGAALQFVVLVVVARAVDARTLGAYLAFSALVRLLGTAVSFGQPWYALRSIAQADEVGDPETSRQLVHRGARAIRRTFAVALAVGVPAGLVITSRLGIDGAVGIVLAAAVAVGGYAFTDLGVDALKARSRTHWGLFLDFSLTPLAVIAVSLVAVGVGQSIGILALAVAHAVGTVLSAAASFVLWEKDHRRLGRSQPAGAIAPVASADRRSTISFGLTSLFTKAAPGLPQILLPLVMSLSDVGRIGAAIRLTSIPGVLIVGLSSVYGPRFARLAVVHDRQALRGSLRESQVWVTGLYVPFAVAFIVAPEQVASLLGTDFAGMATPLRILGIAQLVNALTGLAPMLLTMSNHEIYVVTATTISVVGMSGGSVAAGAVWGAIGASLGYAAAITVRNVLIYAKAVAVIRHGTLASEAARRGYASRRKRASSVMTDA